MSKFTVSMQQLNVLEEMAEKETAIHKLHPLAKIIVTFVFIVAVISSDRYNFAVLLPYFAYTFIIGAVSETPQKILLKRAVCALPFCMFAGISNIIFEPSTAVIAGGIHISYGMLSCLVIILKTYLTVTAVLLLTASTPMGQITNQLIRLHVPSIIVMQITMTYRYLTILADEASSMFNAYILRSNGQKGIKISHIGSFIGQLLIRSFDRAERIYAAMQCFGYHGGLSYEKKITAGFKDYLYCMIMCALIIIFRAADVAIITGGML